MGRTSAIEWTSATWNPIAGCTRVSAGCDLCYAARLAATRMKHTKQYEGLAVVTASGRAAFNGTIRLLPERLDQPLRWRRPRRIFVNSMSDLFHAGVPDDFIDRIFGVMWACLYLGRQATPGHTFQLLTKRPERMVAYLRADRREAWAHYAAWYGGGTLNADLVAEQTAFMKGLHPRVWLGVSVEDQRAADERIPLLLQTPAAVRWISAEPLLGPIDLGHWFETLDAEVSDLIGDPLGASLLQSSMDAGLAQAPVLGERLHWVVAGGESGPGARPMDPAWAPSIRDQCVAAGVPFFLKQLGGWPDKRGGDEALLDGERWTEMPQ